MGIQAWFIILGVGAMTLIVWDGKRRKKKQRASGISPPTELISTSPLPDPASESALPLKDTTAIGSATTTNHITSHFVGGSRIGSATYISGKIIADESVLIKGQVEGAVIAPNHTVSVTATGRVGSYLEGGCVDIDGYLLGTLKANTKATLLPGARLEGVVEAPALECIAGAWLQVNVVRKASRSSVAMLS